MITGSFSLGGGSSAVANNRLFVGVTALDPVGAEPTVAEIQALVTAQAYTDGLAYFTGTDTSTDDSTSSYHVDGAGVVTEKRELLRLAMPVNSAPYYGRQ